MDLASGVSREGIPCPHFVLMMEQEVFLSTQAVVEMLGPRIPTCSVTHHPVSKLSSKTKSLPLRLGMPEHALHQATALTLIRTETKDY